jgi:16S rRNA (cytosine1402-N4)-methyltransferase
MSFHIPVLLNASVDGLQVKENGIYVDATFGGGGHSREILNRLKTGRLIAFDQDPQAGENAKAVIKEDERFLFIQHNFRFLKNFIRYHGFQNLDGLLADLGVSSHHLNDPGRGFSYRFSGALDMRMNPGIPLSASVVLNTYNEERLMGVFRDYGEIHNARRLTSIIVQRRSSKEVSEIGEFLELIKPCIPVKNANKYLSKVFQALRIEVNGEIDSLRELLLQAGEILVPGGRLVIITYHSLEDRIVKNFIRAGNFAGEVVKDIYGNFETPFRMVNRKVIVADESELESNPRARSAKLRIGERTSSKL